MTRPGYQCIIEGCPGNHRSKWQVCPSTVPVTNPVLMNPREQVPDFDWSALVQLRQRAGY